MEAALAALGPRRDEAIAILDLGTGSGCLLVALLGECRQARGLGVDLSADACATAAGNALRNGVGERARFVRGDWLSIVTGRFDLIVSNPPYIVAAEIAGLPPEVRDHDPWQALDGGADGLDAYRALAPKLAGALAPGGIVVTEIGAGQEGDVIAIMRDHGLVHGATRLDLGGHARALVFAAR